MHGDHFLQPPPHHRRRIVHRGGCCWDKGGVAYSGVPPHAHRQSVIRHAEEDSGLCEYRLALCDRTTKVS